ETVERIDDRERAGVPTLPSAPTSVLNRCSACHEGMAASFAGVEIPFTDRAALRQKLRSEPSLRTGRSLLEEILARIEAGSQDPMKSNGSIIDITLGTVGNNTGGGGNSEPASLRAHIRAKDYDGIAKDAATLRANFTKIEAFWVARKVEDAINFSKAALKASG